MQTPKEIKKGLEKCSAGKSVCEGCEFSNGNAGKWQKLMGNALAYIQKLERELAAALCDMNRAQSCICNICKKHYRPDPEVRRYSCQEYGDDFAERICSEEEVMLYCSAFEWRGVCPENTKEDTE